MSDYEPPPAAALKAQAALLGGYLKGPIMLVLCGAQGSGKTTFCERLLEGSGDHWVHLCQDTINNGKPGKREKVEKEARDALQKGHSVVVDRTHLDPQQRQHFFKVAQSAGAPAHALLLLPPKETVAQRVRERTNHPAGVEGEKGARIAATAYDKISPPKLKEGFQVVTISQTKFSAERMWTLYRNISPTSDGVCVPRSIPISTDIQMPSLALGTMGIGKRKAPEVFPTAFEMGWNCVDTAPTYKNEAEVGTSMDDGVFCIAKVPKCATKPEEVREELSKTLSNLQREKVDLLLLHWPCDVIEAGTLQSVWKEMEACLAGGLCRAIGVCNFSVGALRALLPHCSVPPAVNQVERHPLLPQWDLVQFCMENSITIQAHSPLGQGRAELSENPVIAEIAQETGTSPAQVVLQWNLLHGVGVVPKCSSGDHLREALGAQAGRVFLNAKHMEHIDALVQQARHRFVAPPFMFRPGAAYAWGDRVPK